MMKTRPVAVTAAGMLGLGMLGIAPAGAQEPSLGISPGSGPAGTTVTVSGSSLCEGPDATDPTISVVGDSVEVSIGNEAGTIGAGDGSVDQSTGAWGPIDVATDAEAAEGTYIVSARCLLAGIPLADLGGGNFTVEAGGEDPPGEDPPGEDPPGEEPPGGDGDELPGPGDGSDDGPDDVGPDADDEDASDDEDAPAPAEPAPPINGDADYTG